jgi:hypothetical protein
MPSAFTPSVQASIALAGDGNYYAPLSIAVPTRELAPEKEVAAGKGGMMVVAFARDPLGNIVSMYEKHWLIARPKDAGPSALLTLQSQMPVPQAMPLRVDAIVQLPSGQYAVGQTSIAVDPGASPRLTSLIVTNEAVAAPCTDNAEALCIAHIRLRQPASATFAGTTKLVAYIGGSDFALDPQTKQPRVGVTFALKSAAGPVANAVAQNVQALPGPKPDTVLFLGELDLKALPAGEYTLQAKAHDLVRGAASTQQTKFTIQ